MTFLQFFGYFLLVDAILSLTVFGVLSLNLQPENREDVLQTRQHHDNPNCNSYLSQSLKPISRATLHFRVYNGTGNDVPLLLRRCI